MKKRWKPNKRNRDFMLYHEIDYQMEYDPDEECYVCYIYAPIGKRFESSGVHTDRAANNRDLKHILDTIVVCTDPDCDYCVTDPYCPLYN